jgi:hypothetical protein
MKYWLARPQLPVNPELLWEMQGFCKTALGMKSSPTMVRKAEELLHLIEIRVSTVTLDIIVQVRVFNGPSLNRMPDQERW